MAAQRATVGPGELGHRDEARVRCTLRQHQCAWRPGGGLGHIDRRRYVIPGGGPAGSWPGSGSALQGCGQLPGDEGATGARRLNPALRGELGIAGEHRVAVNAKRRGQGARPRQTGSRQQPATADIGHHCLGELEKERELVPTIQSHRQLPGTHRPSLLRLARPLKGGAARAPLCALRRSQQMDQFLEIPLDQGGRAPSLSEGPRGSSPRGVGTRGC